MAVIFCLLARFDVVFAYKMLQKCLKSISLVVIWQVKRVQNNANSPEI